MQRNILVTGATRGIGRELVVQLTELGHSVYASGRDEKLLQSLMDETGCRGAVCDLADPAAAPKLYELARAALGCIDILVNNAGYNPGKEPITAVETATLDGSYAVNLRAPFLLCREALRDMGERGTGHIVNVVSTIARTSSPSYSTYCTLKHALHGFTQCLIKEAREVGVKVTGIYPGGTDTEFRAEDRPDYMQAESAARMILHAIDAPDDVVVHELVYRPMIETNF